MVGNWAQLRCCCALQLTVSLLRGLLAAAVPTSMWQRLAEGNSSSNCPQHDC